MFRRVLNAIKEDLNFAYVGGTDLVTSALGAAFWLYFASIVVVEDYGQIAYLISASALTFTIASLGMSHTVLTFVPKGRATILNEVNSLLFLSAILAGSAVGIVSNNFVVALLVISLITYMMSTTNLLARTKHKEYAFISIGNKSTQIALSLLLYFIMDVNGFILGYALANFAFSYKFVSLLSKFTIRFEELKKVWKFSTHIFLSSIVTDMRFHWDKILIGLVFGYFVLGSFHFSFQFYSVLAILIGSFVRYLLPYESGGSVKKNFKLFSIAIMSSIVVVIIFAAPFAIPVFYPQYVQSITAIQILSIVIIPQTISSLISVNLMAENKRTQFLLFASIIASASYISLIFVFGPLFGVAGLATSLAVASTIQMSFLLILSKGKVF